MNLKLLTLIMILSISKSCSRKLSRCKLVHELRLHKFPEDKMSEWVCLVEQESAGQTDVVSKPNKNGSRDHGLFQINDGIWCSDSRIPGKDCGVTCAELRTDDITKASICAKKIFEKQGFAAWHGWTKRCQKDLPDVSSCDSGQTTKPTPYTTP